MRSLHLRNSLLRRAVSAAPFLILLLLATLIWAPGLFGGQTLVHGDYVVVSLTDVRLHAEALAGRESFIWTRQFYGGHPLFAESQGNFANPVNIFFAAFVTPLLGVVYAASWLHWFYVVLASIGMMGLSRTLGLSRSAQIVAGVATVFSSLWVYSSPNQTIVAILATIPWTLWAFEVWMKRPSFGSGIAFGAATAWIIFAGYPHAFYATILFLVVRIVVEVLAPSARKQLLQHWRAYVLSGALAIAFCAGVSAVQVLPMLELVPLSFRSEGTSLFPVSLLELFERTMRGALFQEDPALSMSFPLIGSVLVCALAMLAPILNQSPRVLAYFVSGALLLNLGLPSSPLFQLLYDNDLLPGLHLFRVMYPFHFVAVVAVGALAGMASDAIRSLPKPTLSALRSPRFILSMLVLLGFAWLVARYYQSAMPAGAIVAASVAGIGFILLLVTNRVRWAAAMLALVITANVFAERTRPYQFLPADIIHRPPLAALIHDTPQWQDFKHIHSSVSQTYGFTPTASPELEARFVRFRDAMISATNELWGLNSMHGSFALRTARRAILDDIMEAELAGTDPTPAGLRMIDILGMKFVTLDTSTPAAEFSVIWRRDADSLWAFENHAALPRFQFYSDAVAVGSPQQALDVLNTMQTLRLAVEAPAAQVASAASAPADAHYQLLEDHPTRYRLRTRASAPVWLFLADSNYPGWRALIDGAETPLYSAQVLGKAVYLPAGEHEVVIEYRPLPLYIGAGITALTLLLTALAGAFLWFRHRRTAQRA